MGNTADIDPVSRGIAVRLKQLRQDHHWSLEELAAKTGVSRATLSRLENAEVSPTASVLGKLCVPYSLTISRLMSMVESDFTPLVERETQTLWQDRKTGFRRRSVSPPAGTLAAEVLECELDPGARVAYDAPPKPGLEHHIVMLEGHLEVTIDGTAHDLNVGDCLRYQLFGASSFRTPDNQSAKYVLVVV